MPVSKPSAALLLSAALAGAADAAPRVDPPVSDADAPVSSSFQGPCRGGETWAGGRLDAEGSDAQFAGIASFRYCDAQEYTLAFYCAPGSTKVALNVEMLVTGARSGEPAEAVVLVDEDPFEISGFTFYNAALDGAQPLLEFDRSLGLLDALGKGSNAILHIGPESLDIHLTGSGDAIAAMLSACS